MATIKSSTEHLTLNADGVGKDIKFQANGVEVSSISSAGAFTSTSIDATKLTGALPAIDGSNLTGINAVVVGTTLPSPVSPEGSLFYKSDVDIFYISDGTQWNLVSNSSPATTGGTVTIGALSQGGTFSYNLGIDFEDDVDTDAQLTYTLYSGTMPGGCTLPTAGNTAFTGTATSIANDTNYTWTIKATDTSGGTATQNYQQIISVPLGASSSKPGNDCLDIYNAGIVTDGWQWINPNGVAAFQAYCGGMSANWWGLRGWTCVYATPSGATSSTYRWTNGTRRTGNPVSNGNYRLSTAELNALYTEGLVYSGFKINNANAGRANHPCFNTSTTHGDFSVSYDQGWTGYGQCGPSFTNNGTGGDFGITSSGTLDHHGSSYYHLNSGCVNHKIYQYGMGYKTSGCASDGNNAMQWSHWVR